MAKIVFVNQATGYLTIDIINAFARSGRFSAVALLAGSVRVQDVPLENSVDWQIITRYNRGNPFRKLISWAIGSWQIGWKLMTRFREYEVVYFTVPPFAYFWSLVLPNRFSLIVFDVYPDAITAFGISTRNVIFRAWASVNRKLLRKAHRIFTLGSGMKKLMASYVPEERVVVIPNWAGIGFTTVLPGRESNPFLIRENLVDKFVVQYSGNIGYTHPVEVLLDVAGRNSRDEGIVFLIIGRGDRFDLLKAKAEQQRLSQCRFFPFQPDHELIHTLSAADLSVVVLDDRTPTISIPSKLYNLQAVGSAILGIAHPESELCHHLERHGNGACFRASDTEGISDFIQRLRSDRALLNSYRKKSLEASVNFTANNAIQYFNQYVS